MSTPTPPSGRHGDQRPASPATSAAGSPGRAASAYDRIADIYDAWSRSVREDIDFYVEMATSAGGPVVELAVGTGRIALAVALAGVKVIGVDSSAGMLAICQKRAADLGVTSLVELRHGDLAAPSIAETVNLVMVPFRSYLHLHSDDDRLRALVAARNLLAPGGRLVFDVFCPSAADIGETHGRWLEREPGIWERAEWRASSRRLRLSVRGEDTVTSMELAWLEPDGWLRLLETAGFVVEDCYGWFDRRPFTGGEDTVWVARRPD